MRDSGFRRNDGVKGRNDGVKGRVSPPGKFDLAYHKDWRGKYGPGLFQPASFRFRDVDFEAIARATRN